MKTQHKHAAVTIAWLQDQSIKLEFKRPNWMQWDGYLGHLNPITHPGYEWRVKPEPKPDVIYYAYSGNLVSTVRRVHDDIELTIDGETGKLKTAEVLS